ncbi:ATP-binding protein [Novispirillum sp. DQ9]|uniref:ATP-binding protein n=1 Tax=Novispirillum sp. DQ9 TaxID=3398612 RepID=UPI003C7C24CB
MSAGTPASPATLPRGRLTLVLGIVPGVATAPALAGSVTQATPRPRALAALMVPSGDVEARTRDALGAKGFDGPFLMTGDLDEVLAARPDAVLVEDLLELNPSGSRHLTRHQDVVELLDHGIAVHAGVSVTQLRAARELIRRHTGILPRNTLPEDLVGMADEVELADVPPAVLLERRAQGDRRLTDTPAALFTGEALGALRALALDITRRKGSLGRRDGAPSADGGGTGGGTAGRVLVLLANATAPDRLVRAGHRLAEATGAPWAVAHVPQDAATGEGADAPALRRDTEDALRLADSLGAEIVSLAATDLIERVIDYAQTHHVTDIVVGRPARRGLGRLFRRPLADRLTEVAGGIAVHMVGDTRAASDRVMLTWRIDQDRPWFHEYAVSTVAALVAAVLIRLIEPLVPAPTLAVIPLMAVLYAATAYGFAAALFTSVLSVGLFNVFFLPPFLEFKAAAPENLLLLAVFALMGGITANLAGRLHDQAATAYLRERNTAALFRLAREVATAPTPGDVLKAVVHQLDEILGVRSALYLPPPGERGKPATAAARPVPAYPPPPPPPPRDREAIDWVHAQGRPAGPGTGTYEDATALYWPLRTPHGAIGVLALSGLSVEMSRQPQFRRRLESLSGLAAVAIERMMLSREIESARFTAQTESLRSALLSSISHDLRTPLASIIGSATSLLSFGRTYEEAVRQDLLRTILEEAERLNRFVGNLLQMTKLESGAITPKRQWIDVDDLVGTTLERMERRLQEHAVVTEIEPLLPPLSVDFVLMENVLTNLLDNAVKYSPAGSTITVRGHRRDGHLCLEVSDQGIGIAPDDHAHVFDKFFRVYAKDSVVAGTGLGLAICKGIVETHGGTLELESQGPDARAGGRRGTTFRILLPLQALPEEYSSEGSENA